MHCDGRRAEQTGAPHMHVPGMYRMPIPEHSCRCRPHTWLLKPGTPRCAPHTCMQAYAAILIPRRVLLEPMHSISGIASHACCLTTTEEQIGHHARPRGHRPQRPCAQGQKHACCSTYPVLFLLKFTVYSAQTACSPAHEGYRASCCSGRAAGWTHPARQRGMQREGSLGVKYMPWRGVACMYKTQCSPACYTVAADRPCTGRSGIDRFEKRRGVFRPGCRRLQCPSGCG